MYYQLSLQSGRHISDISAPVPALADYWHNDITLILISTPYMTYIIVL